MSERKWLVVLWALVAAMTVNSAAMLTRVWSDRDIQARMEVLTDRIAALKEQP